MDKLIASPEVPGLVWIQPDWPAPAHVRAAASTRLGGVSAAPYASLNLRSLTADDAQAVRENRERFARAVNLPGEPAWLKQVHGTRVLQLPLAQAEPEADASWTDARGAVCVAQTADCLPVLLCDDAGSVVAAVHAGWRGLCAGILETTVRALPAAPQNLMAWIGPAIGPGAFEVGAEVREAFMAHDARAQSAFVAGAAPGKFMADLPALARQRLADAGVPRVYGGQWCTHDDAQHFFSYRRDGVTGRLATMIWLT